LGYSLSAEYTLSEDSTIGLDMTRGVSLSPFSEGVSFTGATYRWYYPNLMPSMVKSKANLTTVMIQEWAPYAGPSFGVAQGTISRQKDLVSEVNASGIYVGMHAGVDYQVSPNLVSRYEMATAKTLGASGGVQSSLSEFLLQVGLYYILE
jgi:hypothetical protein